jgi:hypothetical protein
MHPNCATTCSHLCFPANRAAQCYWVEMDAWESEVGVRCISSYISTAPCFLRPGSSVSTDNRTGSSRQSGTAADHVGDVREEAAGNAADSQCPTTEAGHYRMGNGCLCAYVARDSSMVWQFRRNGRAGRAGNSTLSQPSVSFPCPLAGVQAIRSGRPLSSGALPV